MATIYPLHIDNLITLPSVIDGTTPVSADTVNRLRDAIFAIESAIGVDPAGIYATVATRLIVLEQIINGAGGAGNVVVHGSASVGQTIIWNGSNWMPGTDFVNQNVQTAGQMISGPNLSTSATTGLNQLTGKLILNAISPLKKSNMGQGIIYFDESTNQFLLSQNGSNYFPISAAATAAGGDLGGIYPSPTVIQINGASVPVGGALVSGNILQVVGNSTLAYGPVNVGGGDGYIEGILPAANQAPQTLGGDITGTAIDGYVVALRGIAISPATPLAHQVLEFSGSFWVPTDLPSPVLTLVGDVNGLITYNTVDAINGASVPAAGTLIDGYILQVTGSSTLEYAPLNLSGGPTNYLTGILPEIYQEKQTLGGDLSGTTSSATIVGVQGNTFAPGNVNTGQALFGIATNVWGPTTISGDIVASPSVPGQLTVTGIQNFPVNGGTPNQGQFLIATSTGSWGYTYPSGDVTYAHDGYYDGYPPVPGELTVTGIQGVPFTSLPPTQGYFVVATSPTSYGLATTSGDISSQSGFGSTPGQMTVTSIQGVVISGTPASGQALIANSSTSASWQSAAAGGAAGGDLSGSYPNPTVVKLQGRAVLSTAPTSNQVLTYNGTSWQPSNAATGGSASGDLSGTYPSPTVAKIQGNTVTSGALTKGQFFVASSTSNWAATTLSGDITESATTAGQLTVTSLQGTPLSGTSPTSGQFLGYNGTNWIPTTASTGGAAGGDLSGTYPNPTVTGIQSIVVPSPTGTNTVLTYNAGAYTWSTSSSGITQLTGDIIAGPGSGSQSSTVTAIRGNPIFNSGPLTSGQNGYVLTWDNTDGYWVAEPPSTGFVPSGTGIPHIISGIEQAVATLIVNADVDPSAAIAYSKLNLAGDIVDSDISNTAAIAYSKLNLTGDIVNSDISSGAAIDGTKISPNFGSQVVQTTGDGYFDNGHFSGTLSAGAITISSIQDTGLSTGVVHSDVSGNFTSSLVSLTLDVTGVLPAGNQANQTMAGDVTGTTGSSTVVAIQNNDVRSESLTVTQDGYVLTWDNGTGQWRALTPNSSGGTPGGLAGGDLGGLYPDPTVEFIQGNSVSFGTLGPAEDGYAAIWDNTDGVIKMSPIPTVDPTLGGDVTGTGSANTVVAIQNIPVSNIAPTTNQVFEYNGSEWLPTTLASSYPPSGPAGGDLTGTYPNPTIADIQSNPVNLGVLGPAQDGYVMSWDDTDGYLTMVPVASGSFSAGGDLTGTSTSQTVAEIQGNQINLGGLLSALQDGYVLTWDNTLGQLVMAPAATGGALEGDVTGALDDNTVGQRKTFLLMGA